MQVIPAIDIIGGRCVRLSQGDYARCTTYSADPVEIAKGYADAGLERLHVVDLDGAKSEGVVNLKTLEQICRTTTLKVDFGGGVKTDRDLTNVFDAGAAQACIGSVAATNPELVNGWLAKHGAERLIISADVQDGVIKTHGWRSDAGLSLDALIVLYGARMRWLMCTDISRDGMFTGAATELYARLVRDYPWLRVIASGGIGSVEDIEAVCKTGVQGVVVGKAIYEWKIKIGELKSL